MNNNVSVNEVTADARIEYEAALKALVALRAEQKDIGDKITVVTRQLDVRTLQQPGNPREQLLERRRLLPSLIKTAEIAMLEARIALKEQIATAESVAIEKATAQLEATERRFKEIEVAYTTTRAAYDQARRTYGQHRSNLADAKRLAQQAREELAAAMAESKEPASYGYWLGR